MLWLSWLTSCATLAPITRDEVPSIQAFECFRVDDAVLGCAATSELGKPAEVSLRAWENGAPRGGPAWNPWVVECRAVLRTPCRQGVATLRVGTKVAASTPLVTARTQLCRFRVTSEALEGHADEPSPAAVEAPWQTAVLRVEVAQECGDEPGVKAYAHDALVTAFGFGE